MPNGHTNEHLQILANAVKEKYILKALAACIYFDKNKKPNWRNGINNVVQLLYPMEFVFNAINLIHIIARGVIRTLPNI